MESRFGNDFSNVRIHAGPQAASSAKAIDARAYTAGSNVVFGAHQYQPGTPSGRRLLAHELVHVVQQGAQPIVAGPLRVDPPDTHEERVADAASSALGSVPSIETPAAGRFRVQRQPTGASVSIERFPAPGGLSLEQLLKGIFRMIQIMDAARGSSVELTDVEEKSLPAYVGTFVSLSQRRGLPTTIVGLDPRIPSHQKVLQFLPQPAPNPFLQPPAAKPAAADKPAGPAKPAPAQVEQLVSGIWPAEFQIGLGAAIRGDAELQKALDEFGKQLAAPGGKSSFGLGLAIGLPVGAGTWVGDQLVTLIELALNTGRGDAVSATVKEFASAMSDFVGSMSELGPYALEHPREMGQLVERLASEKVRRDLLLQLPLEIEAKLVPTGPGRGSPVAAAFGVKDAKFQLPKTSADVLNRITSGEGAEKGQSVRNRGIAFGMQLGAILVEIATMVLAPEDLALALGSQITKVRAALKGTRIAEEIARVARRVPSLQKRMVAGGARVIMAVENAAPAAVHGSSPLRHLPAVVDTPAAKAGAQTAAGAHVAKPPQSTPATGAHPGAATPAAAPPQTAAPATTSPATAHAAQNLSRNELLEPVVQQKFHPKSSLLSNKSAGFDFAEGHQIIAHTETKAGRIEVDERIAGGNWTQLKIISATEERHAIDNTHTALERAENALKGVPKNKLEQTATGRRTTYERAEEHLGLGRNNQFEKVEQGHSYRSSYERQPDRMTIHLHFENIDPGDLATQQRLEAAARREIETSVHKADLPPIHLKVTFGKLAD